MEDLTGRKYGKLTVLRLDADKITEGRHSHWICQCECGRIKSVTRQALVTGKTTTCGKKPCREYGQNAIDMTGQRVGHLYLERRIAQEGKRTKYECLCDCGRRKIIDQATIRRGSAITCGCHTGITYGQTPKQYFDPQSKVGKRYGSFLVEEYVGKVGNSYFNYRCRCDCGKEEIISSHGLRSHKKCKECLLKASKDRMKKVADKSRTVDTDLHRIDRDDARLCKANTSGITGVSYISTRDVWSANMTFQGIHYCRHYKSKKEAINARKAMKEVRDEFVTWYKTLSEKDKNNIKNDPAEKLRIKQYYSRQIESRLD